MMIIFSNKNKIIKMKKITNKYKNRNKKQLNKIIMIFILVINMILIKQSHIKKKIKINLNLKNLF